MSFVVLQAHMRVSTPINTWHLNVHFAWISMVLVSVIIIIFLMFLWIWPLWPHQLCNKISGHSMFFDKYFAYMWLETWDNLHSPIRRWLPIVICTFCIVIRGGTQLLSCPHPVDHPCISLVSQVQSIGQIFVLFVFFFLFWWGSGKTFEDLKIVLHNKPVFNITNIPCPFFPFK